MSKKYYRNFPKAPVDIVSGIAGFASIPTIVDARVSADMSIFLDIEQDPDEVGGFQLTADHLMKIAAVCGVELKDVFVEDGEEEDTVSVTVWATPFDFSNEFRGTPYEKNICFPREEEELEAVAEHYDRIDEAISKLEATVKRYLAEQPDKRAD